MNKIELKEIIREIIREGNPDLVMKDVLKYLGKEYVLAKQDKDKDREKKMAALIKRFKTAMN